MSKQIESLADLLIRDWIRDISEEGKSQVRKTLRAVYDMGQAGTADMSPSECRHFHQIFICGGHGAGLNWSERYGVTVCKDCGEFHVFKEANGQFLSLDFTLATDDALAAAGKWVRLLQEEEAKR